MLRREQRGDSVSGLVPMVRRGVARSIRSRRLMGLIRLKYVHPGRSRTRNLQIPLSFRYLYLRHSMVVLSHFCVFEGDTNAHMLESDALPLCYRAVLYGVYRYVSFIRLSIPLCWGSLWVWSVRGEVCERGARRRLRLMYSLYSFFHARLLPSLVTTRRRALSGRSNARRCY